MDGNTILCQPDSRKGCSACCGLFNFRDISRNALEKFLEAGAERGGSFSEYEFQELGIPDDQKIEQRDITSHICPYQGFLEEGRPGCLMHPSVNSRDLRNRSLFGKTICSSFLCPAHEILNQSQKMILINRIDDWYTYSLAILDPCSFAWICDALDRLLPAGNDHLYGDILARCISLHGEHLRDFPGPVFHYSLTEYRSASRGFSLVHEAMAPEREKISAFIREAAGTLHSI